MVLIAIEPSALSSEIAAASAGVEIPAIGAWIRGQHTPSSSVNTCEESLFIKSLDQSKFWKDAHLRMIKKGYINNSSDYALTSQDELINYNTPIFFSAITANENTIAVRTTLSILIRSFYDDLMQEASELRCS